MRLGLQYGLWALGFILQVLVLRALLRGPAKRYPLLLAYTIALFFSTITEIAAHSTGSLARLWKLYWIDDAILQALLFAVVISLIHQAMATARARASRQRQLVVAAFLLFALLFAVHAGPVEKMNAWMTLISRDLSFAAVVLDLVLWTTLVASRTKNQELLMLSGGLGIQFAGAAIGQSIRQLTLRTSPEFRWVALAGSMLVVISHFICLYVWWQTFRRAQLKDDAAGRQAAHQ
ncbi:MAG TPA: hypothetical protein VN442_09055 [Bryobacteraceae bacterium]|nr:hypothetical protein [Bryobacteraceae bacterium]